MDESLGCGALLVPLAVPHSFLGVRLSGAAGGGGRILACALSAWVLASCQEPPENPAAGSNVRRVLKIHLGNAHWIADRVMAGAQPEGDAAFKDLAALGVKTVISVDGARPDTETARRNGLRYVHLPVGYDGIPEGRALELAKAIQEADGPVYVHCHHGLHRGPAAAAVACVVAGRLDTAQAIDAMKLMGTGPQYLGLWSSARAARKADDTTLRSLKVDFSETAPVPPLVDAMVNLDAACDHLEQCARAGWKTPLDHPDLDPAHEALKTRELCAEIRRTPDCAARPDDFRAWIEAAARAAANLETLLRAASVDPTSVDRAFATLRQSCADCHKPYRNVSSRRK